MYLHTYMYLYTPKECILHAIIYVFVYMYMYYYADLHPRLPH